MHPLDILGHPVRRRILELLATGERPAGDIVDVIGNEFGIGQPAVSGQLRLLREADFVRARTDGTRRIYRTEAAGLDAADAAVARLRSAWRGPLDALHTEVARGKRQRNSSAAQASAPAETLRSDLADERNVS